MRLADRVVALGVGEYHHNTGYAIQHPVHKHWSTHISADEFESDWRVAGAVMEECLVNPHIHIAMLVAKAVTRVIDLKEKSLSRAIIEAGVAALEGERDE